MKDKITAYGGIRVGSFNATWPLVKMSVYKEEAVFSIVGIKKIRLKKDEIISATGYTLIPFIGEGVLFTTKEIKKYGWLFFLPTNRIIFWSMSNSEKMTKKINEFWN